MMALHASISDVARFTGFVLLGVGLPGFVLWRLIGAYRRNLVEDCAAGFAVGTSAQLIVYLGCAAVGLQRWSWAWAPIVLVIALVNSNVRTRVWRQVQQPLAPLTAWLLSAACALVMFVIYRKGPATFAPAYTDPLVNYQDMSFHQALTASAKYDVPIKALWVAGEPMRYHTFFHQVTAATSWATGIDLTSLIYSLAWLPLVLAGSALVFVLTQRFLPRPGEPPRAGATWAGPLAVVIAGIGGTLQPLQDTGLGGIAMAVSAYLSPTQNLGMMLALVVALLSIDLLRGQPPWSRWVLLILVALASSGSKATILPLAGCGFLLVLLFRLASRRSTRTAFVGGLAMLLIFISSVVAIFRGESSGLQLKFAAVFAQLSPYTMLRHGTGMDRHAQLLTASVTLLAWGLAVAGVLFIGRFWRDPGAVFLAGFAIAGFFGMLLTSQPGMSQIYFFRTAFPMIVVLSCLGLANLVERLGDHRGVVLVALASLLGLVACAAARVSSADLSGVKGPMLWTVGALVGAAAVLAIGWKLSRRGGNLITVFLAALVTAGMVGATAVPLASLASEHATGLVYAKAGWGGATRAEADAARWIRDNSKPGDLVATNAHCIIQRGKICDSRHFWIAALSERPVLVEGWSYTNKANRISITTGINPSLLPFWDRNRLATNDAAFTNPSTAVVESLHRYGVRWLFADNRAGKVSPNLKQYVRLRYATLDATIYEFR
jgi:hypothetical protein